MAVFLGQCSGSELSSERATLHFLGRWDVVATEGDASYPLWFELERIEDQVKGRFQPRGGHSLPIEEVSVEGGRLQFSCCGFEMEAGVFLDGLQGRGKAQGTEFTWEARRAPELAARENPEWGQPIDLLTDGLDGWRVHGEDRGTWTLDKGRLINSGRGSNIYTKGKFRDFQLHTEVNCPKGGNSGIYLRGRYEIQVQDDYGKPAHSRHMGGVYGYLTPTKNAARQAGEWQEFEVVLVGRWVTVVLNGEMIIDQQEIPGVTGGALDSAESEPGPIYLQGDHGSVSYRNIILMPALE